MSNKFNSINSALEIVYQKDFGTGGGNITYNPKIKKVSIDGVVESASNGGVIFTLPTEYCPQKRCVFYNPCMQNGAYKMYNMTIQTDGKVVANAFEDSPMEKLRISGSYIIE